MVMFVVKLLAGLLAMLADKLGFRSTADKLRLFSQGATGRAADADAAGESCSGGS